MTFSSSVLAWNLWYNLISNYKIKAWVQTFTRIRQGSQCSVTGQLPGAGTWSQKKQGISCGNTALSYTRTNIKYNRANLLRWNAAYLQLLDLLQLWQRPTGSSSLRWYNHGQAWPGNFHSWSLWSSLQLAKSRVLISTQMMLSTGLNTAPIHIIEEKGEKIQDLWWKNLRPMVKKSAQFYQRFNSYGYFSLFFGRFGPFWTKWPKKYQKKSNNYWTVGFFHHMS